MWKTRVIINPNRQPMETHFFERAGYFLFLSSFEKIEIFLSYFLFFLASCFSYFTVTFQGLFTPLFLVDNYFCNNFSC